MLSTSSTASMRPTGVSCPRPSRGRVHHTTRAFWSGFGGGGAAAKREVAKEQLLELIKPLERGAKASEADKQAVDRAAAALERLAPNKKTLSTPEVNGKWELLYTTSESILGTSRPGPLRPWGKIYQTIDAVNLKARNQETAPFFNQVSADLTPMSSSEVAVQFKQFKILGLLTVNAPESAKGTLDITYVDEELRISRGNKNNLFVLRMADPNGKP